VWIGATVCNQAEADRDIPKLVATPAAKRFLSMEPLLGLVPRLVLCQRISLRIRHHMSVLDLIPTLTVRLSLSDGTVSSATCVHVCVARPSALPLM